MYYFVEFIDDLHGFIGMEPTKDTYLLWYVSPGTPVSLYILKIRFLPTDFVLHNSSLGLNTVDMRGYTMRYILLKECF